MTINVRPATPEDAPAVAAIAQEAHALHAAALPEVFQPAGAPVLTPAEVARLAAQPGHLVLVALAGGEVVGYGHAEVREAPASPYKRARAALHVVAMAVAATARGRGAGRALVAALRAAAAERGLTELSLEVYSFNVAARAFYARAGFVPLREHLVAPVAGGRPGSRPPAP